MLYSVTFLLLQLLRVHHFICTSQILKLYFAMAIAVDDLTGASPRTVSLPPLGSGQISILFSSAIDNLDEEEECLVFILSVDETQLDPRDQGQVDIDSDVALGRLQDVQFTCTQNQSVASILVDCDGNFVFDEITCLIDGATPEPCKFKKFYIT